MGEEEYDEYSVMDHLHDAHELYTQTLGGDSLYVAAIYDLYAVLHRKKGEYAQAVASLKESLYIKLGHGGAATSGSDDTNAMTPLVHHICPQTTGTPHDVTATFISLAEMCEQCGKDEEAFLSYEKAMSRGIDDPNELDKVEKAILRTRKVLSTYCHK